jgi:hypothetical protein
MDGKKFVKVTSIIMIVGGSIAAIAAIIGIMGISALVLLMESSEGVGILYATTIMVFVASVIQIVAGIKGLKACKTPQAAGTCVILGFIIAGLAVVALVISVIAGNDFNFLSLVINLIVPGLYIYGALQIKKGLVIEDSIV